MTTNNFIALNTTDIIIYNHIQSKIYKYFISFHKKNNSIPDINYCKCFKFNICLCHRDKNDININPDIYKCPNNKRILYNLNNFNFLNPISITNNNTKIYPIDIFTYYRQEYLPFIINVEFNIYKNNNLKLKIIYKKNLLNYFNHLKNYNNNFHFLKYNFKVFKGTSKKSLNTFHNDYLKNYYFNYLKNYNNNFHFLKYNFKILKGIYEKALNKKLHISYNNNSYYNDLIDVFNKNPLNTSKTIATQTEEQRINYSLLFAIILNDYTNLIGDYNDLLISLLKY